MSKTNKVYEMYCNAAPEIAKAIKEMHQWHGIACAYFVRYPNKELEIERSKD